MKIFLIHIKEKKKKAEEDDFLKVQQPRQLEQNSC